MIAAAEAELARRVEAARLTARQACAGMSLAVTVSSFLHCRRRLAVRIATGVLARRLNTFCRSSPVPRGRQPSPTGSQVRRPKPLQGKLSGVPSQCPRKDHHA